MKKAAVIFIIFFLTATSIFSQDKITIALASPYTRNKNPETFFFQKHFIFELFYSYSGEKIIYEVLNKNYEIGESEYLDGLKNDTLANNYDYLLYSAVYTNQNFLFFKVNLINPSKNEIFYSRLFTVSKSASLSDQLSEISYTIVNIIEKLPLSKKTIKLIKKQKKPDSESKLDSFITKYKHEIFFVNSFFKNHGSVISFLELSSGYSFSPFNFFSIEGAIFFGYGDKNNLLLLNNFSMNYPYTGVSAASYFFLPLVIEPGIGFRVELSYIFILNEIYLTIPVDISLKIYITSKDLIKINSSFHFTAYNLNKFVWENNYIAGFSIGYARKI